MSVELLEERREKRERGQSLETRVSALENYIAMLIGSGDIASGAVKNLHIGETLLVGNTEAKCTDANADQTAANAQSYSWITGTKPPTNADATQTALNLGAAIDYAKANGVTLIQNGYIRTGLINASYINTGVLSVGYTQAKCTDANADQTSTHTAYDITHAGGTYGWLITSGYIKSYNGAIELKGSTTPHIKALYSSSNYVQMTAASNVPRFDVYYNNYLRTRLTKDGLYFYTTTGSQKARIYGDSTKGLYIYASNVDISGDLDVGAVWVGHSNTGFSYSGTYGLQIRGDSICPYSNNNGYLGKSTRYWHRVYSDSYWTKNTTFQTFDKYDDLQILRALKFGKDNKLVLKNLPKEI